MTSTKKRKLLTLESLLSAEERSEMLPDCSVCRETDATQCSICLQCDIAFSSNCEACCVKGTKLKVEGSYFPKSGIYKFIRTKIRCKKCEARLEPIYALERQKHTVVITEKSAMKLSTENVIRRALLPLKLTELVLSGNLAGMQRCSYAREDFKGEDLELITATFSDSVTGEWRVKFTCGIIVEDYIYTAKRPYSIEFYFGTVLAFNGQQHRVEKSNKQMMVAMFDDVIGESPGPHAREMFNCLLGRIENIASTLKEPTPTLHLLDQIRNYTMYPRN